MIEVERFEANPEHGRPKVAELRGREGTLALHCDRLSGGLWLFASGPRGGDRGEAVVRIARCDDALLWATSGAIGHLPVNGPAFVKVHRPRAGLMLTMGRLGALSSHWRLRLDEAGHDELRVLVREWATAAVRVLAGELTPPAAELPEAS